MALPWRSDLPGAFRKNCGAAENRRRRFSRGAVLFQEDLETLTMPKKSAGGIVPVQCADKASEEEMAPPQQHLASMPRCCKAVIVGPAHVGKSSLVHNLLLRSNGEGEGCWGAIYVAHGAAAHTQEYSLIDYTPIDWDEATPAFWAAERAKHGNRPLAVVTDDYAYADASKKARANLYSFVQHCCSHLNISSFMVAHSWTQLTPRLRRQATVVFLFATGLAGQDAVPYIARSLGMTAPRLAAALATCESRFSFLCIHGSPPSGHPQISRDCEVAIEDKAPATKPDAKVKPRTKR